MPRKATYNHPSASGWGGKNELGGHCLPSVSPRSSLSEADEAFFEMVFTRHTRNTHTHRVNVGTCIIDLRSPLQQTPTVIKKRPFCFISPLHCAYQLICIISSVWCCPRKQLPLWFLLLGILSYFVVSLSAAPNAGAPHHRCILNSSRSGASARFCRRVSALLLIVSMIKSSEVDSLVLVQDGVNAGDPASAGEAGAASFSFTYTHTHTCWSDSMWLGHVW